MKRMLGSILLLLTILSVSSVAMAQGNFVDLNGNIGFSSIGNVSKSITDDGFTLSFTDVQGNAFFNEPLPLVSPIVMDMRIRVNRQTGHNQFAGDFNFGTTLTGTPTVRHGHIRGERNCNANTKTCILTLDLSGVLQTADGRRVGSLVSLPITITVTNFDNPNIDAFIDADTMRTITFQCLYRYSQRVRVVC